MQPLPRPRPRPLLEPASLPRPPLCRRETPCDGAWSPVPHGPSVIAAPPPSRSTMEVICCRSRDCPLTLVPPPHAEKAPVPHPTFRRAFRLPFRLPCRPTFRAIPPCEGWNKVCPGGPTMKIQGGMAWGLSSL